MPEASSLAVELLRDILVYDPERRASATEARARVRVMARVEVGLKVPIRLRPRGEHH